MLVCRYESVERFRYACHDSDVRKCAVGFQQDPRETAWEHVGRRVAQVKAEELESLALVGNQLDTVAWERLYRLEIQKFSTPVALASEAAPAASDSRFSRVGRRGSLTVGRPPAGPGGGPRWRRFALVYDVHDRTPAQLKGDVLGLLEGETGRFRINVFYWSGDMVTPESGRLSGRGKDFIYSDSPRGDIVSRVEEPIEFEIENGED